MFDIRCFQDKLPSMGGGEEVGDGPDLSFFDDIRFLFCSYLIIPARECFGISTK